MRSSCEHLPALEAARAPVHPRARGCQECLARGSWWVHLRLCMACGHVGCCDDSPNRHATAHFHASRHPVIKSFEPGENWAYCYADDAFVEEIPAMPGESPPVHYEAPGANAT